MLQENASPDARKTRRRTHRRSGPTGDLVACQIALLTRLVHDRMLGNGSSKAGKVPLTLSLQVDVVSGRVEGIPIEDQISRALQDRVARADLFRLGAIHCYWCDVATCEHARPPRATAVFTGYAPTGQPTYKDLAQLLLDRKDERVETLFSDKPGMVALWTRGRELKGQLLHPFGRASKTYDVLGQLVLGYFRPAGAHASLGHLAVTIQAVESRYPDGRTRLALNAVGATDGISVEDILDASQDRWGRDFMQALRAARGRLRLHEQRLSERDGGASRSEVLAKVPALLRDLARSFEHAGRSVDRRTRHAFDRREERPIEVALRDASEAPDSAILADERRGTFIVLGPRGRAHAFTPGGRHVTSLRLDGESLERRMARRRWRPAVESEIRAVREALRTPGKA